MLVEARDLRKTYTTPRGIIAAVDGLDLDVAAGEFLAVGGRSGSGKSTLLALLGGLCRPITGTVRVDGVDLGSLGPSALAELRARRFGFLFQFTGLLPNLRAIDNIALPALLGGSRQDRAYARARELLEQVGLGGRWDAYPGELSGGQQRRVALARALVNQPLVLLADEPTNDLDEQSEREVLDLLRQLPRAHNTTLIVVSHDPTVARLADRAIYLRNGKLATMATLPAPAMAPAAEPEPFTAALTPAEPTPPGTGLGRFLVGFVGWALLIVCGLWLVDYATARWQRRAIASKQLERKKSEELALQQLRADVEDVAYRPDGSYEVAIYLQDFQPEKPLFVLGPSVRLFVQVDRSWQEMSARAVGFSESSVHEIADKRLFRIAFRADPPRYDELLRGYMHLRISSVMIVSAAAEPGEDLFQRTDEYYVYLKPQKLTDAEVRKRNRWSDRAIVPRWMGMPSH